MMYLPHVTDEQITRLILELAAGDQLPSGAQLRAAMQQRFGSRGGVARVYRLLSRVRTKASQAQAGPSDNVVGGLKREIANLQEALKLADHREQAHQARWAREVDHLRQQLAELEPLALQTKMALNTAELLRRQLHAAYMRIAALEAQLVETPGQP